MKSKVFSMFIFFIHITIGSYAYEMEYLTFTEMRPDGRIIGDVTVVAIFMGWTQQRISMENGFEVTNERTYANDKWSDWQFMRRQPASVPTLRQLYEIFLRQYSDYPRASMRINSHSGLQAVRIMTRRSGGSSPMWWSDDGRSFNILFEVWAIVP